MSKKWEVDPETRSKVRSTPSVLSTQRILPPSNPQTKATAKSVHADRTKRQLLELQKQNGNDRCVDCGAPSPQWV